MRQLAQRVTTHCELRPLTREGVAGYVQHRLRLAGADRDRVEFADAAIDALHEASGGVPRLVNRLCDRALSYGFVDRTSLIGPAQIARALGDLEISDARADRGATGPEVRVASAPPVRLRRAGQSPPADASAGLFARSSAPGTTTGTAPASDLHALLDLSPTAPRPRAEVPPPSAPRVRVPARRRGIAVLFERLAHLKSAALPMLGAGVVLIGGGLAVAAGGRASEAPEPVAGVVEPGAAGLGEVEAPVPVTPEPPPSPDVPDASTEAGARTWLVQAGAFASPARAAAMAARLADAGFAVHVEEDDFGARGTLSAVRVGPFATEGEANQVRDALRARADASGSFARESLADLAAAGPAPRDHMGR
jgi:cell division septation protein DedD